MKIAERIAGIEARRGGRLLVLAASNLELELLAPLYDTLRRDGRLERLDVLLYCRGGIVTAARRIALLLDGFTDRLSFIVPDRCESSGTIMALAGREIVAGPAAIFSPVDPLLQGPTAPSEEGPTAISAEDVRLFGRMARDWFGLDEGEAGPRALSTLCESIFPTTLTAFYRSALEVKGVCEELLSLHMPAEAAQARARIIDQLLVGHHSHGFALSGDDLARIGLPVRRDAEVEDLAWEIAGVLRGSIGAGARAAAEDPWHDALIASREGGMWRRRTREGGAAAWAAAPIE